MRKLNIIFLALPLLLAGACNIAELFDDAEYRIANEVAFRKKEIIIEETEAGSIYVVYYANQSGRFQIIEEDCDWLTLGSETFSEDGVLQIDYARNEEFPRMARVEMRLDNNARRDTLTVKQESVGKPYLWLEEPLKAIYNSNCQASIKVNTNVRFKDVETSTAYLESGSDNWVESMDYDAGTSLLNIRAKANTDAAKTRTAIISLAYNKSFKDSILVKLRLVQANAADDPIAIGVCNLSEKCTSNCYLVEKEGYYTFDASVRGNGVIPSGSEVTDAKISGIDNVKVLWESVNSGVAPAVGTVVTAVRYSEGKVSFYGTGNAGNALIAALDGSGKIIWSWHIWSVSEAFQEQTAGSTRFMDRNLGALSAYNLSPLSGGLFYQGMRKDPFPGVADFRSDALFLNTTNWESWSFNTMMDAYDEDGIQYGTELGGVRHPMSFISSGAGGDWLLERKDYLWGAQGLGSVPVVKTLYDPCPAGYRLPSISEMTSVRDELEAINGAYAGFLSPDKKLFYPACGRIDPETAVKSAKAYSTKTYGFYWTGSVNTGDTSNLLRYLGRTSSSSGKLALSSGARARGHSVRCVKEN
ncbi:MAG: fibrobacter succinogenes major paralogous domain-containing protein [Bacteroidales bacterium]|nr:fibrobacter succinogenes major paralogous domain-containing protein [Bacteroidales bacterium]